MADVDVIVPGIGAAAPNRPLRAGNAGVASMGMTHGGAGGTFGPAAAAGHPAGRDAAGRPAMLAREAA